MQNGGTEGDSATEGDDPPFHMRGDVNDDDAAGVMSDLEGLSDEDDF
jgi:hypothetical protein